MRKVLVAVLALSPMLAHAQANSPATTQNSVNVPVLQSKLVAPKSVVASAASESNATPTTPGAVRITTGVTAPKLISTVEIAPAPRSMWSVTKMDRTVVVSMVVDTNGVPTDVKLVRSAGPGIDDAVVSAVRKYRFAPGTLDYKPTAVPVNLEITLHHSESEL
jgi:TonB family protein